MKQQKVSEMVLDFAGDFIGAGQMKYPRVIKQIISCELTVVDGQDHIFVASTRQDLS